MDKPLPPISTITAEAVDVQDRNCHPKKSTLAFLRQFARTYTVVSAISGPAAEYAAKRRSLKGGKEVKEVESEVKEG